MIFQDPYSSLSPRLRVSYLLTEPYGSTTRRGRSATRVTELLEMVEPLAGAGRPSTRTSSRADRRAASASRARSRSSPSFIVADEPTAGLDVSAAASVLNLMKDLARGSGSRT